MYSNMNLKNRRILKAWNLTVEVFRWSQNSKHCRFLTTEESKAFERLKAEKFCSPSEVATGF